MQLKVTSNNRVSTWKQSKRVNVQVRCQAIDGKRTASRTDTLRKLLVTPGILKGPCCHDALSARLIEQAGFSYAFMSGFCTSGARLGAPDTGLMSYYEMMDQGRYVHEATRAIPIIGDGDTGYGNAMNVKRTVRGYAAAGFAGILIEDQVAPKSCGHVRGKRVVCREEAVSRIRAAADARDEGADILIVARTDARQALGLEEALWRVAAFAEAGADILFVDALASLEEMRAFCRAGGAAAALPKMANMLEGGGKTPILSPEELEEMGFKLVAYPLSLLGASIRGMQTALRDLARGRVPGPELIGSFADIQAAVGFPEYYKEEARYALPTISSTMDSASAYAEPPPTPPPSPSSTIPPYPPIPQFNDFGPAGAEVAPELPVVEADRVFAPGALVTTSRQTTGEEQESGSGSSDRASSALQFIRVRITDTSTGLVKLETRIPANFLNGLSLMLPQLKGLNIESIIDRVGKMRGSTPPPEGGPIFSTNTGSDIIEVFMDQLEDVRGKP